MLRRSPSRGTGWRLCIDRKFRLNTAGVDHSLFTLTAPGADVLPWDTDLCTHLPGEKCSGLKGCRVESIYAHIFNVTYAARMARLHEAAQRHADRVTRRLGWKGELPRIVSRTRSPQRRGVDHGHTGLPQGGPVEVGWSRSYRQYVERVCRRERALAPEVVWAALELEWRTGEITPGVYGFGFSHPGRAAHGAKSASTYQARNAAGYQASNVKDALRSSHYISRRITQETGATMRALRSCNWLYVRRDLIARGELLDSWIPAYWSPEWSAQVQRVLAAAEAPRGP